MNNNRVRPAIHFSPQKGWMNDPNGPVYFNGEYHIFFQHNPNDVCWDSMHWGHARSRDLMHWKELPIALYPDEQGMIFSGCSFVDEENITGFGSIDAPPVLLFYTSHDEKTKREMQCIAYTTDMEHFYKYEGNPVISGRKSTPARDPQVFKNKILGGYSLCLTVEKAVEFYHSVDLINWEKTGEFVLPGYAVHGMIECPCMFECSGMSDRSGVSDCSGKSDCSDMSDRTGMSDRSGKLEDKMYVLMMSMDIPESEFSKLPAEAVPHNRIMQYFTGTFDGNTFIADEEQDKTLLVDYGPDFYAGTIFSNTKDIILIAWLGDFSQEAKEAQTVKEGFKGILSFPRKLQLKKTNAGYRLCHSFIEGERDEESVSYERITGEESITCEKNAIAEDAVIVEESIIDGCVKEVLKDGGFTAFTLYINA